MCCGWLCSCLYNTRSCFGKLLLPLLIVDLGLTVYIVTQLIVNVPFACCTDPRINDCSYDDIDGADNVKVNDNGFCVRKDNSTLDCETSIRDCALTEGIDMGDLCDEDTLDQLSQNNWAALLGILCVKIVGLIFLIWYDVRHTWCSKTDRDGADEDAEATKRCCSCDCTKDCCKSIFFFLLRVIFLIFGTATTFIAILLLRWTDRVSRSTCELLPDSGDESDCVTIEEECSTNEENFYVIVWQNIYLTGPYWVNLAANILSGIIWSVRLAVVWYHTGNRLHKV